jgi:glyoxylase-like metal-dependent hydrolase (beta-lactamase superfamily II)
MPSSICVNRVYRLPWRRAYPEVVAQAHVLFEGYVDRPDGRVSSTVALVRDDDVVAVVDPGLIPGPESVLGPLAGHGLGPQDVTDVIFSHHHPDHTLNAALFRAARFHDHWAIYRGDQWIARDAEGFRLSSGVQLIRTPGHTTEDIATLVDTGDGLVVFTHAWWTARTPVEDPYAVDRAALHESRARILEMKPALIVPGHGAPFEPSAGTPP